jgi:hypothetical protein
VVLVAMAAPMIAACSTDFSGVELKTMKWDQVRPDWMSFQGQREDFTLRPVVQADLVSAEGQCAASSAGPSMIPTEGTRAPVLGGGVSLQMTECEVVDRIGSPDRVEFGGDRSQRLVVLTYTRGSRPGVYRFASGRLYSIERGDSPPEAPKQKKAPVKKKAPA